MVHRARRRPQSHRVLFSENSTDSESLESAEGFFKQFDKNNDNKISFAEFLSGRMKDVFPMTDQDGDKSINLED